MEILAAHWQHIIPIIVILIAFHFIQRRDQKPYNKNDNKNIREND